MTKKVFSALFCSAAVLCSAVKAFAADHGARTFDSSGFNIFALFPLVIFIAVAVLIIYIIVKIRKALHSATGRAAKNLLTAVMNSAADRRRNQPFGSKTATRPRTPSRERSFTPRTTVEDHTASIAAAVREHDRDFLAEVFLTRASDVFLTLQRSWSSGDLSPMRTLESGELYSIHARQLQHFSTRGQQNVIENIRIDKRFLHKYERAGSNEYLTAYLEVRMSDYVMARGSNKLISGDPCAINTVRYLLTFMRSAAEAETSGNIPTHCPNCGAPVENFVIGYRCAYCRSEIQLPDDSTDWLLVRLDVLKKSTAVDNRGVVIQK